MSSSGLPLVSDAGVDQGEVPEWLPTITSRPVLPLEEVTFCLKEPQEVAAVKSCWASGCPVATIAETTGRDGSESEARVGTALRLEEVEELPDGTLEVHGVGLWPFSALEERVRAVRPEGVCEAQMTFVNFVRTRRLSDDSEATDQQDPSCAVLRKHVRGLLGGSKMTEWSQGSDADFSWRAAARLSMPTAARGVLLHLRSAEERLSFCSQVLLADSYEETGAALPASYKKPNVVLQGDRLAVITPIRSRL